MKEISFGDLDFRIVNSYRAMRSRIKGQQHVSLFGTFPSKIFLRRRLFGVAVELEIEDLSRECYDRIHAVLRARYGKPDFVSRYGAMLWKEADFCVIHAMEERSYGTFFHTVSVSFKRPYPWMLSYDSYEKSVAAIDAVASKWHLERLDPMPCVRGNFRVLSYGNGNYEYRIRFTNRKYAFYSTELRHEAAGIRMLPSWSEKGRYQTLSVLCMRLDAFFAYLEEYDARLTSE